MKNEVERYYVCGTYGDVRIFDRRQQKYVSCVRFKDELEARLVADKLNTPAWVREANAK